MQSLVRRVAPVAARYVASKAYNYVRNRNRSAKANLRRQPMARGSYSGKFKKARRYKTSKFSRDASSITVEYGNYREDTETVYIGHGFNWKYGLSAICTAIIKKLANMAGVYPVSMNEKFQGHSPFSHAATNWTFRITYKESESGVQKEHDTTFVTDSTWQDMVDSFTSYLLSVTVETFEFLNFSITVGSSSVSSIDAQEMYMNMYYKSTLNLQNQTTGYTSVDDQANDVTNNPLQGMRYWGNGSGFHPRYKDNTLGLLTDNSMVVDKNKSVMYFDPNGTNVTTDMQNYLRRPPSKGALVGCTKTARIVLNPGNIKKGILSKKILMNLNQFWRKIIPAITGNAASLKVNLGNCEMFAFEKMCRTGAGDSAIRVGFEVNQIYKAYVWVKKKPTVPHHYIL